jgi:pSer/pThr/pTyr-binding forkhead associated (FHA) protein
MRASDAMRERVAERLGHRHAELRPTGRGWALRDLGSTNGTLLNGRLVAEARVAPGDVLALGDLRVTLG